tara:strand:- start:2009 stop:3175 length:1167 start_codon:yes stop_codon:yes gene_type:complete
MKTKKKEIYDRLVKNIKLSKMQEKNNLYSKISTHKIKSYSPYINNNLDVKKLKTLKNKRVNLCNNLLEINLGTISKPKCLYFNNILVKKFLLKNLMGSKHLDPYKFIAPKQLYSNCWFNTMFVTFFFSDKGRKFFRFFRNLMITGRKVDNTRLEDQELRKLLFVFNLYIEASYNQDSSKLVKNKANLHEQVKNLTSNLDTNFLIKKIYNRIKKISPEYSLPNMDEAGNPLEFYKVIMSYLNYDTLKILTIDLDSSLKKKYNTIENMLKLYFNKEQDIIIFEDHESKINYDTEYELELNNKKYKYKLDSIILTNKSHYKPNTNSHFVSVLTINKEYYKFDGSSYSKLSKFNWKKILNKNVDWTFKENPLYYPEKYNFKYGYKILFYYRS